MSELLQAVYLVRHGETAWSLTGQHTGLTDIPLTPRGERNARRIGERLAGLTFAKVFTSPLQRAARTCELAGFGSTADVDLDLVEWNYGKYEGLINFVQASNECWEFPGGYSDIVELSEEQFTEHARLDEPERRAKRQQPTPVGDLLVSFLKVHLAGSQPLYLMVEFPVKLPVENHSFMQFMLSKGTFHMRLRGGGIGVVSLTHLAGYTVYPGVAQIPADTWIAEPISSEAAV